MRNIYLVLFVLSLFGSLVPGQTISQAGKIMLYTDSCMVSLNNSDTARAYQMLMKILPFAEQSPPNFLKGDIYRMAGNYYVEKWDFNRAEAYFGKALEVASGLEQNEKELLKASVLFNRSKMYHHSGDLETALKLCLEAEHLYDLLGNREGLAETHNRLGGLYTLLGQVDKQQYHNRRAYREAILTDSQTLISKTLNAYGNYHLYNNDPDSALYFYNLAIESAIASGNNKVVSDAYYNKAVSYSQRGEYKQALNNYSEALKWAKAGNLGFDECDALYKIGLIYYYMQEYGVARDTLLKALSMAQALESKILKRNIYDVLSFLEANDGNFQTAYDYLNKYIDLAFDIVSEEGRRQVNFLEAMFQAEKRENEILRKNQQLQRRSYVILITILVLIATLITIAFQVRQSKNKQTIARQQAEIKDQIINKLEKEKELIAVQSTLIGEETERTRIARDIHDGVGGMLSGVKLTLNNMKGKQILDEESANLFGSALQLIDASVKELRKVAHNMMPEILLRSGLKEALDNYCRSIVAGGSIALFFNFHGEAYRLQQGFELMVYRVGQELLNNAIRHSAASRIVMVLIQADSHLSIAVNDNGKGFHAESAGKEPGKGLANIQARVSSYDGSLDIHSVPGKDTEVMAAFHNINQFRTSNESNAR